MSQPEHKTTDAPIPNVPPCEYEDEPMEGDWITCWRCGGEGGEEGDDPFWDLGEWIRCDICKGEGGWLCEHPHQPPASKDASHAG